MLSSNSSLQAGAATQDITPTDSVFLYGYPFVPRYSKGVHDPLLSSALYISDGHREILFIANDIIWLSKHSACRIRERISRKTTVAAENIMISATHTHSGPMTLDYISNADDEAVPRTDAKYVEELEEGISKAGLQAVANASSAVLGLAVAHVSGIGGNRHNPYGPADPEIPVLVARSATTQEPLAAMLICSMHPTVLHEDSMLISGDFPAMSREYLQRHVFGRCCPILHHTGPAGNQSPRHVTVANTFAEAERLGEILARSVETAARSIVYSSAIQVSCARTLIDLPRRTFPSVAQAANNRQRAVERLAQLRRSGAARTDIRTAEVDWFGAEETLSLARLAATDGLEAAYQSCLPAEIQVMRIGNWNFVGWQGEVFVEFALAVKSCCPNTFLISLANGDLQGYICTREAFIQNFYEAGNSLFHSDSGDLLVERTIELIRQLRA